MNVTSLDNKLDTKSRSEDDEKTPTNKSSETLVKFTLGVTHTNGSIQNDNEDEDDNEEEEEKEEEEDQNDNTLDENQSNNLLIQKETYPNYKDVNNRFNLINSYSHSLPQLRINSSIPPPPFPLPPIYNHQHMIQPNYPPPPLPPQIQNFNGMINKPLLNTPNSANQKHLNNQPLLPMAGLYNDMKLNSIHFHNLETFNLFIRYSLNLNQDLIKELITNTKVQFWIDRNKSSGFIYQACPKLDESKRKIPPVRCELCKFYGHLSHTCTIKDVNIIY
jgi:hypothetical protein